MKCPKFSLGLIACAILFSCNKSAVEIQSAKDVKPTATVSAENGRPAHTSQYNSGSTTPLTSQGNGSYTATWGGANLVFTNLPTPTSSYVFGDGLEGYTVQCTNGNIISTAGSYFVGSINVMSQADADFILQRVNGYAGRLFDFTQLERMPNGDFKQAALPNFYNEVMVSYTGYSIPFSGGVIYDPGVPSHMSITPSSFVATIANTSGTWGYLGETIQGNYRLQIYTYSTSPGHIARIDAFDKTTNVQLDTYSASGSWKGNTNTGGIDIVGSVIVGSSSNTPTSINTTVYGD